MNGNASPRLNGLGEAKRGAGSSSKRVSFATTGNDNAAKRSAPEMTGTPPYKRVKQTTDSGTAVTLVSSKQTGASATFSEPSGVGYWIHFSSRSKDVEKTMALQQQDGNGTYTTNPHARCCSLDVDFEDNAGHRCTWENISKLPLDVFPGFGLTRKGVFLLLSALCQIRGSLSPTGKISPEEKYMAFMHMCRHADSVREGAKLWK
ncbi:hypothetical protein K402DRAFT_141139 [Aulographum hederae CBS 113979]|uniref:Uncharacterized protein n=1 Tax=Aulographum hederae CBS 113979 TaxID=1176131 RepID=A0A6G1GV49_9PEZI|nr:hypothetical protein K402DRAFT_141139 [Aulographum hederae CBS 113979]